MITSNPHVSAPPRPRRYRFLGPYLRSVGIAVVAVVASFLATKPLIETAIETLLFEARPGGASPDRIGEILVLRFGLVEYTHPMSWSAWIAANGPRYVTTRLTEPIVFLPLAATGVLAVVLELRARR